MPLEEERMGTVSEKAQQSSILLSLSAVLYIPLEGIVSGNFDMAPLWSGYTLCNILEKIW